MTEFVQLAHTYEGKNFEKGVYSRKFDGKRMIVKRGVALSRTEKLCRPAPVEHIVRELDELTGGLNPTKAQINFVTDGEVLYFDKNFQEDFKKAVSLTSRIARSPECDNLYYVIFDLIPLMHFEQQAIYCSFEKEYTQLYKLLKAEPIEGRVDLLKTKYPHILIARQTTDMSELTNAPNFHNWEGIMYRNWYAPYEYKRSKNILKIKEWQDIECKIIDFKEGLGKHLGRLGAILVEYEGCPVYVGSGFNDYERQIIWDNREALLAKGLNLRIKYFEKSCDAKGNVSLRFPTYICFRDFNLTDIVSPLEVS